MRLHLQLLRLLVLAEIAKDGNLLSLLVGLGGLCAGLEKVKRFTILPVILMIRISCVVFVVTY